MGTRRIMLQNTLGGRGTGGGTHGTSSVMAITMLGNVLLLWSIVLPIREYSLFGGYVNISLSLTTCESRL